jgi:hypothetical protein
MTASCSRLHARLRAVWQDERGLSSTVEVVLLFPLVAGLLLVGVQTVLWQNARSVAADNANQTAALVASGQLTPTEADQLLTARLDLHPDLTASNVTVTRNAQLVTVTVTATAPGMLAGTRTRITLDTSTPTEGWQPLP